MSMTSARQRLSAGVEPATCQANKVGGRWRIDPDVDLESLSSTMNERVREEMKAKG